MGDPPLDGKEDDHVDHKYKPITRIFHSAEIIVPLVNKKEEHDNQQGCNKWRDEIFWFACLQRLNLRHNNVGWFERISVNLRYLLLWLPANQTYSYAGEEAKFPAYSHILYGC